MLECVPTKKKSSGPYCRECTSKEEQSDSHNETTSKVMLPLISGTYYCVCQFNTNHFKLLVPDKRIKFHLVISIETKEFAEFSAFDFLITSY